MKVNDVLEILCAAFPLEDAEEWDNPGFSVGSPNADVTGVACALDVTPTSIQAAYDKGCNVLVAHHPIFMDAPGLYTPEVSTSSIAGASTWLAANLGVSVISMHTNLDKSALAMDYLASVLGVKWVGRLEEPDGFGALLDVSGMTFDNLAAQCAKAFNTQATIWKPDKLNNKTLTRTVFCSGSTGDLGELAIKQGLDCIICGECGYHKCLVRFETGVGVILLGHDASELPFAQLLANTISEASSDTCIVVLDEPRRWQALA